MNLVNTTYFKNENSKTKVSLIEYDGVAENLKKPHSLICSGAWILVL